MTENFHVILYYYYSYSPNIHNPEKTHITQSQFMLLRKCFFSTGKSNKYILNSHKKKKSEVTNEKKKCMRKLNKKKKKYAKKKKKRRNDCLTHFFFLDGFSFSFCCYAFFVFMFFFTFFSFFSLFFGRLYEKPYGIMRRF